MQNQVPQESIEHGPSITASPSTKRTSEWFLKNFPAVEKKDNTVQVPKQSGGMISCLIEQTDKWKTIEKQ